MLTIKRFTISCFTILFFCCFFAAPGIAKEKWRDVSSSELAMTKGKVEADADAEAIFWEVRVDDASANLVMRHYVRLKIFTERGREKFSKVDIPYVDGVKIKEIQARVVKTDGSIVELADDDVFDREIIKSNDVKVKAKSFAVPNIEEGVIVEYQFKEVYRGSSADDMPMIFQRDIPMQYVAYYFKPYQSVKYLTFNLDGNKFEKDKGGFYKAEMSNVPALKEEPQMPPEDEVRSWLLVYYTSRDQIGKDAFDFWSRVGGRMVRVYDIKDTLKPGKKMRAAAEELTTGATTPEEKLRKLYDFCKLQINNLDYDTSLTEEQKDEIKLNKDDDQTYEKRQGRSFEINKLFASLTDAAGFETRIAFTGDRSKLFFNPGRAHESFIHMAGVGIKMGNRWKYFDPGTPFLEYGKLAWFEENTSVFLLAYKDYITTETPMSGHDESREIRKATLELTEDGTLSGTVTIEYTGHLSFRQKLKNYDVSEARREEFLKEEIKERMSSADVSNVVIENVTDPEKPFRYRFKISVPNYAQKTGKRIFFQPGFFEFGTEPRFVSASRKYDIYFHFPWSESDEVIVKLPEGYSLDNADAPAPLADNSRISSLEVTMGHDAKKNLLVYKRNFYFGGGGNIFFPANTYQPIKALFDAFHKANSHVTTLIKEEAQ